MICKKCGIEIGRQDQCPECGFINGYNMDVMPDDLKEIDEILPAAVLAQKTVRQSAENRGQSVPVSQRIRHVSPGEAIQATTSGQRTQPVFQESQNGNRKTADKIRGSNAESYLGKVPQPEFKHANLKKQKKNQRKGLLGLVLGMMICIMVGFLFGLLIGRILWHRPQLEAPLQSEEIQTESVQLESAQTETVQTEPIQPESENDYGGNPVPSQSGEALNGNSGGST